DGAFHYDRIRIPAGVTVTLAGPLPAILRARRGILVEGRLVASGAAGFNSEGAYNTATLTTQPGGAGGPGGGAGGTNSKDPAYGMP
ncbi:MAG: hypothetical protein L6R43_08940, partial [Planctomycetes bacterium]|nr:hypothetical protein [Planctomycetota bacterium]